MIVLALVGCPRPSAPPSGPSVPRPVVAPPAPRGRAVAGPAHVEADGLCLDLPGGWTGTVAEPLDLALVHPSGLSVTVTRAPPGGFPAARAGYQLQFEDPGPYRSRPGFPATRSWLADAPFGDYLEAWYGDVGGPVEVSIRYPPGAVTASEPLVDALFAGFCRP